MTLGEEWYREFWRQFSAYVSSHEARWKSATNDKKWSRFMFDFLTDLAQRLDFQEQEEEPALRTRRFDRVWRRENYTVVLEHENEGVKTALRDEIPKLARRTGNLHICITYLPTLEFPGHEYAEKCKDVLEKEGFKAEFLLVLGTYEMSGPTDWVCHRIFPETTLKSKLVVLPPSSASSSGRVRGRRKGGKAHHESS